MIKTLIINLLCVLGIYAQAQTTQQFIDIKCQELALDEARAEAELKRIKIERTKLNATKIELNVKLYQEQLTQLELKKANDLAKIEAEYLKEKGKILSMMQVTTSIQTNPQCTSN